MFVGLGPGLAVTAEDERSLEVPDWNIITHCIPDGCHDLTCLSLKDCNDGWIGLSDSSHLLIFSLTNRANQEVDLICFVIRSINKLGVRFVFYKSWANRTNGDKYYEYTNQYLFDSCKSAKYLFAYSWYSTSQIGWIRQAESSDSWFGWFVFYEDSICLIRLIQFAQFASITLQVCPIGTLLIDCKDQCSSVKKD